MQITLIQYDIRWHDKTANRQLLAEKINALSDPGDLIVLPEMFTTGFSMEAASLAEDMEGPTIIWMKDQAARSGAAITGSFICREDDHFFNRLVWMQPDGRFSTYDKRHLFSLAKEQQTYHPGRERLIVSWKDWRICPLICYDLRFPVWSRNTEAFDLLVYVANWPDPRRNAWKALLRARAIENQVYTVGVNRVGADAKGHYYAGDSTVVDFKGETLLQTTHTENISTLRINLQAQRDFQQQFAFLQDRDDFNISL